MAGFDLGVLLFGGASDIRLDRLHISGIAGKAIILSGAPDNTITHNTLTRNADAGIGIFDGSNRNLVARNFFSHDGPQAIENNFANANTITRNRITHTGSGVILESSNSLRITHNRITHSVASACDGCGIAIQVYGNSNVVARNNLIDSPRYGIEVDDFQDPGHSPARDNLLRDNRVHVSGIGIAIGPEAGGVVLRTLIQNNNVTRAAGDGIQLVGPSTGLETSLLTKNVADDSGALGIDAVPGVRDGGGNKASGNADARECLNVVCH
jgi:parallel beta-helix repeat protein